MALMIELPMVSLVFVWVEALRPSQQFFSHVGTFSWVAPILSNEDEVSCSRTQHRTLGEILTCNLAIKNRALYQLYYGAPNIAYLSARSEDVLTCCTAQVKAFRKSLPSLSSYFIAECRLNNMWSFNKQISL